ncbi:MAG: hypothetical protein IKW08_05480 [Roseburia sp.]|nr:hypothetical protein [Roseburia sp.]
MIVLNATPELRLTFEKLIQTMEVPVKWNGLFVVIDNTLILQGDVRSLFFHFDSRKVMTNIIDLDIKVQQITPVENNPYIKNVINMLLYAFGKWGNIKGLTVEKDYAQLGKLFANILGEMDIEPEYTKEHFWFFQKGVRIVYEEVVECALSYKEKNPEIPNEESKGLWHKLVWKQTFEEFPVHETTARERNRNRLGNNFYLSSYACPDCKNKMHGVVYQVGGEFTIDTNEGRVKIARAYTCGTCCTFYTPRPRRLLIDGDCYLMDFAGDKVAYQDYQELLGKNGGKFCNPNYNTYVDKEGVGGMPLSSGQIAGNKNVAKTLGQSGGLSNQSESDEWLLAEFRELLEEIDDLPKREFEQFFAKVTEGFFPEKMIEPVEKELWKKHDARKRGKKTSGGIKGLEKLPVVRKSNNKTDNNRLESRQEKVLQSQKDTDTNQTTNRKSTDDFIEDKVTQEKVERYKTRLNLFSRLSERQRNELVKQISMDASIPSDIKNELLDTAKARKKQDNFDKLKEKVAGAKNKNRLMMFRVYEEIDEADLEEVERKKLFELTGLSTKEYHEYLKEKEDTFDLREAKSDEEIELGQRNDSNSSVKGHKDVGASHGSMADKIGKVVKRNSVHNKKQEVENSTKKPGINRSAINKASDIREIESMIRETRSTSREDLKQLLDNLLSQDFDEEVLEPYVEHVRSQIKRLDEEYLDSLLGDVLKLSSDEGTKVYEEILSADILPELKANALNQLELRLSKIKTDECELLVQKLRKEMEEAGVKESDRHYYYPAKRVLEKEAAEEEVAVIDYAKASYGAGMGLFEYPIWAVDTTLSRSGEKGMFLTPEKIYYSNLTTSYRISVFAIDHISASTGLLNRGLYVHQKNGGKIKLPYAVETTELPKLAEVLDAFVKYLQEKPFSRKEVYLAQENHEEICCFRCGYVYRWADTCPKCGYKANQ